MKKLILSAALIALGMTGMASCAKTTKGKMKNDWKVSSYMQTGDFVAGNGNENHSTETVEGSMYGSMGKSIDAGNITTSSNSGTVHTFDFSIKSDGTWETVKDISFTTQTSTGSTLNRYRTTTSGTWNFVGKNKTEDFRKNEKVIFHSLKETRENTFTTSTPGQPDQVVNDGQVSTFFEGDKSMLYTVTESSRKELQLSSQSQTVDSEGTTKLSTQWILK